MSETSSANPDKLDEYLGGHTTWVQDMRVKVQALADEVAFYNRSASVSPKVDADLATELSDFVERWAHLDDFVADVARAFVELRSRHQGPLSEFLFPAVLTFSDTSLYRLGQIGFADREDAIREARASADALQAAIDDEDISRDELAAMIADVRRGQHDPAFAVELSNRLGVAGYADTVAVIRQLHPDTEDHVGVSGAGHDAVEVLAMTLTTAMHAPGSGLSSRFESDLLDEDLPITTRGGWPDTVEDDLAVLLGNTAPPTALALQIADSRLSPLLAADAQEPSTASTWGSRGGLVSNYAEMLSHDTDASAAWLADGNNLELVLERDTSRGGPHPGSDRDGGRALAEVVENGLTNENPAYSAPDPETGGTRTVGERLLDQSIEVVADLGEIHNDYLPEALAAGVDQHMDLIDHRINDGWTDANLGGAPTADATETFDFFKAVTRDADAADQVAASAEQYVIERMAQLQDATEHERLVGLTEVGQVRGLIMGAEGEVLTDDTAAYIERQQQRAERVNFAVGLVPYYPHARVLTETAGIANAGGETVGVSVGDLAFPSDIDDLVEQFNNQDINRANAMADSAVLLYLAEHPDEMAVPLREMTDVEHRAFIDRVRAGFELGGGDPNTQRIENQRVLYSATSHAASWFAGND